MGSLCGFFTASLMVIYVEKAIAAVRPHIAMHSLTHSLTHSHSCIYDHACTSNVISLALKQGMNICLESALFGH